MDTDDVQKEENTEVYVVQAYFGNNFVLGIDGQRNGRSKSND